MTGSSKRTENLRYLFKDFDTNIPTFFGRKFKQFAKQGTSVERRLRSRMLQWLRHLLPQPLYQPDVHGVPHLPSSITRVKSVTADHQNISRWNIVGLSSVLHFLVIYWSSWLWNIHLTARVERMQMKSGIITVVRGGGGGGGRGAWKCWCAPRSRQCWPSPPPVPAGTSRSTWWWPSSPLRQTSWLDLSLGKTVRSILSTPIIEVSLIIGGPGAWDSEKTLILHFSSCLAEIKTQVFM